MINDNWRPLSGTPSLNAKDVHVWRIDLVQSPGTIERLQATLSQAELAKARRFHRDCDKRRYVVSHGTLRQLLGIYVQALADELEFCFSQNGKPALSGDWAASGLKFNMSHSHDLALLAIARSLEVGVDVEHIRVLPRANGVARRFFSSEESQSLAAIPEPLRLEAFFSFWTRKEALLKAMGTGLSFPLDTWSVAFAPGESANRVDMGSQTDGPSLWELIDLKPRQGYLGAVAVEGVGCVLTRLKQAQAANHTTLE